MYPVMLNLKNKPVVVVGGGKIATRKINGLLKAGAVVTVISPNLNNHVALERIKWKKQFFDIDKDQALLNDAWLIFACTDDLELNRKIKSVVNPHQWVNVTSEQTASDFFNTAVIENNQWTIGISTNGKSPTQAKQLKQKLTQWLDENQEDLFD